MFVLPVFAFVGEVFVLWYILAAILVSSFVKRNTRRGGAEAPRPPGEQISKKMEMFARPARALRYAFARFLFPRARFSALFRVPLL